MGYRTSYRILRRDESWVTFLHSLLSTGQFFGGCIANPGSAIQNLKDAPAEICEAFESPQQDLGKPFTCPRRNPQNSGTASHGFLSLGVFLARIGFLRRKCSAFKLFL